MSRRARRAAFLVWTLGAASVAACGSRTGLFGADNGAAFDASVDARDAADAKDVFDAADANDAKVACIPGNVVFTVATTQLMFVLDRSGSMAYSLDGAQKAPPVGQSRWEVLHSGLEKAIVPYDQQIAMGAKFFPLHIPFDPNIGCEMDDEDVIAPALGNSSAILQVFTQVPLGGTPTYDALVAASKTLASTRSVSRAIVLATDGEPNCNPDLDQLTCACTQPDAGACTGNNDGSNCLDIDRTVTTITDLAQKEKTPTYVLGIVAQSNSRLVGLLDQMAIAGGRPRPAAPGEARSYNVQTQQDMDTALGAIRDSVSQCTYLTPSAPTDPTKIQVFIDGTPVDRDPSHTSGWDWVDKDYGELAFFGASCTVAIAKGNVTGQVACEE